MSYCVKFVPKAAKALSKLPKEDIKRILEKFDGVKEAPFLYLEHYEGKGYKLRIGHYRALIDVDFPAKVLKVRVLDHRGRIYNRYAHNFIHLELHSPYHEGLIRVQPKPAS